MLSSSPCPLDVQSALAVLDSSKGLVSVSVLSGACAGVSLSLSSGDVSSTCCTYLYRRASTVNITALVAINPA